MVGHIKIDRKILNWEWYQEINVFRVFIHLLLTANYKECRWKGIIIGRGQVIIGTPKLATALRLGRQEIRTSLNKLKSTNEITIKVTNKYSIVTICKYDIYQSFKNENNQQDNQQANTPLTNNQPTTNQQLTTNNNNNNNNNDKKERVRATPPPVVDISKSNLFRQPNIPTQEQVCEVFHRQGGSKEMAKVFFDNYSGTGWFLKGSPITNFVNLVPSFISNWKKFSNKNKATVDPSAVTNLMKTFGL